MMRSDDARRFEIVALLRLKAIDRAAPACTADVSVEDPPLEEVIAEVFNEARLRDSESGTLSAESQR